MQDAAPGLEVVEEDDDSGVPAMEAAELRPPASVPVPSPRHQPQTKAKRRRRAPQECEGAVEGDDDMVEGEEL